MTDEPKATYLEDEYIYLWDEFGLEIVVERFREERGTLVADVQPRSSTGGGFLPPDKLNLGSARSIKQYANTLESRGLLDADEWFNVLSLAASLSTRRYREGVPPIDLWTDDLGSAGRYLVRPFIFDDAVNIIYGSGDSGKSLLSIVLAAVVASGKEIAGIVSEREGPVVYLDWEDSAYTHQERLRAICGPRSIVLGPGRIIYRRMDSSLRESAREIRKLIATTGAVMAIVDSVGMACGGDPSSAEHVIQTMLAARSLGVPVLAVHHITKDAKDKSNPYGSVYAANEARMSWYVESQRDGMRLTMVATNYKANRGARHERQSFHFAFTEDDMEAIKSITVGTPTFSESKTIGDGGQKWKIAKVLQANGKMEAKAIAVAAEITHNATRTVLNRQLGKMFGKEERDGEEPLWWVIAEHAITPTEVLRTVMGEVVTRHITGGPPLGASVTQPPAEENEEEPDTDVSGEDEPF